MKAACALSAAVLGAVAGGPVAAQGRDPLVHFFYQSFGDLREELATAREEGKVGLLLMFDDDECPWCRKMKATVLNRVRVQEYYRRFFRPIRIDTQGDGTLIDFEGTEMIEKDFAFKIHRVRATPVFIFFGLDGEVLMRYTGITRSVDEFLWLGEFVAYGRYKHQKFTAFKRRKLAATGRSTR